MTRKTGTRLVVAAVGLLIGIPCVFFACWAAALEGSSSGSPELAEEWRETITKLDIEPAKITSAYGERFPNGEWAVWLAANSHGIWVRGGGTVVIKDSRGQVRAFFGHVCGCFCPPSDCQSLDDFYRRLVERRYREHYFGEGKRPG